MRNYWWMQLVVTVAAGFGGCSRSESVHEVPVSTMATSHVEITNDGALPSVETVDPFGLPSTAAELITFMNECSAPVTKDSAETYVQEITDRMQARAAAAAKLLQLRDAKTHHDVARKIRMESLQILASVDPAWNDPAWSFARELQSSRDESAIRTGRLGQFALQLNDFLANHESDPRELILTLDALLTQALDRELYDLTSSAGQCLADAGHHAVASQVQHRVSSAFASDARSDLAADATLLSAQADLLALEAAFQHVLFRETIDASDLVDTVQRVLNGPLANEQAFDLVSRIAEQIEWTEHRGRTKELWQHVQSALIQHSQATFASDVRQRADQAKRRATMTGTHVSIIGKIPQGRTLSTASWKSHPIVIIFWRSNSDASRVVLHSVQTAMRDQKLQSLRTLSICLDDEVEPALRSIESMGIDMPLLLQAQHGNSISIQKWIDKLGVGSVPFVILLDRSHRVADWSDRWESMLPAISSL